MPQYSMPTNPVGTFNPCWIHYNGYNWGQAWNTAIIGSPAQYGADVLSNCVGWSVGRMLQIYMEVTGYNPNDTGTHPFVDFGHYNAGEWYDKAVEWGFEVTDQPAEGTVLVTPSHVANVERYDEGYGWLISESGYDDQTPWYLQYSLYESGGQWYSSYATTNNVIGFIKIPGVTPGPGAGGGYDRHRSRRFRIYEY